MPTAQAHVFSDAAPADSPDERFDRPICIPTSAHTFDGFVDWINADDFPEGLQACWHEGDILLDMSPEEIESHNRLKARIYRTLDHLAEDEDLGLLCLDGVSLLNKRARVVAEPDGIVHRVAVAR